MRRLVVILAGLPVAFATPAVAQALCEDLWGERNAVYAEAGYCFKTERAIRAFGNGSCRFDNIDDVPLSAADRRKIAAIVRRERELRCPR